MTKLETPSDIFAYLAEQSNSRWLREVSKKLAASVVTHYWASGTRGWRAAAKETGTGHVIYRELQKELKHGTKIGDLFWSQIDKRAAMFTSVPLDTAKHLTEHATKEALKGRTPQSIAKDIIEQYPHISRTRANLIARTEAAKTQASLTESRSQEMGYHWYIWQTAHDERVRSSHRHMQGVICRFDDPPDPEELIGIMRQSQHYNPGGIWNCRCYSAPVVNPDFGITWPAKVYANGKVVKMTKREFVALWMQDAPERLRNRLKAAQRM